MEKRGVGKSNEGKLLKYLLSTGSETKLGSEVKKEEEKKRGEVGRPKRDNRPERSAAKRTYEGEERYTITLETKLINKMKGIGKRNGSIKKAFKEACEDYIKKANQ